VTPGRQTQAGGALGQDPARPWRIMVLVAVSIASVAVGEQGARGLGWVIHTVEVENQTNAAACLEIHGQKARARLFLPGEFDPTTSRPCRESFTTSKASHLRTDNPDQNENVKRLRAAVGSPDRPVRAGIQSVRTASEKDYRPGARGDAAWRRARSAP